MIETPKKNQSSTIKTPPSKSKGKGRAVETSPPLLRSNKKDQAFYQAEADYIEEARDREDPDFQSSSMDGPANPPRKKRKSSDAEPTQPAKTTKTTKSLRARNISYDNCHEPTKKERDTNIVRIKENWNVSDDQILPKLLQPSKTIRLPKAEPETILLHPRDWNGEILRKLVYLSALTRNMAPQVHKDLKESVTRKDRGSDSSRLMWQDIEYVTEKYVKSKSDPHSVPAVARARAAASGSEATTGGINEQEMLDETMAAGMESEQQFSLPSPRSPTFFADDRPVKQEPGGAAARPSSSAQVGAEVAWDGYDEARDEYELAVAEEEAKRAKWEALQKKRRLRQLVREHGKDRRNAILITPATHEE